MKLHKVLTENQMARSRAEAERLIKQNAVSIGGCDPSCSFFSTGKCSCGGWQKTTNPSQEIENGTSVKIGSGFGKFMRADGSLHAMWLWGVCKVGFERG